MNAPRKITREEFAALYGGQMAALYDLLADADDATFNRCIALVKLIAELDHESRSWLLNFMHQFGR